MGIVKMERLKIITRINGNVLTVVEAAEALAVPFLGEIPIFTSIRQSGDAGKPIVVDERYKLQGEFIQQIARNLAAQVSIRNSQQAAAPALDM
ncbi:MAG: hypothetical protein ABI623_09260 [bacterium]